MSRLPIHLIVFGAEGQLGTALQVAARSRSWPVTAFTRAQADITETSALRRAPVGMTMIFPGLRSR